MLFSQSDRVMLARDIPAPDGSLVWPVGTIGMIVDAVPPNTYRVDVSDGVRSATLTVLHTDLLRLR